MYTTLLKNLLEKKQPWGTETKRNDKTKMHIEEDVN